MITVNSLSGGKTSSYIAKHYPADYDVFSLVRVEDQNCKFPDEKIRKEVEDRLQAPFVGTVEDDTIIYTMLDLEQFIGREISWVTGITFDEVVRSKGGWLPNMLHRYCTTNLKLMPIFHWWHSNIAEPVEMRIGFRANEQRRAKKMIERKNENGLLEIKATVEKHPNGRNKWETFEWQSPSFPLILDNVYKDNVEEYWKDKPVRFAWMNNCIGCFHRNEILLKKMFEKHPAKMQWFADQEIGRGGKGTWKNGITYEAIKEYKLQFELFDDEFDECDSGYCGL
jgi:hypothetical protein